MGGDGFEVSEGYCAFDLREGGGEMDVHGDSQVIGDVEIDAGELLNGETGRADQVQGVAMIVGGEVDMLGEIEAVQ